MKVQRKIERRMEVMAHDVYNALAQIYDLPLDDGYAHFENDDGTQRGAVTLVFIATSETELAK
jgi:hypothetical protein